MHTLKEIDKRFFLFINDSLSNPFFDALMPFLRNSIFWVPLYVFLLAFALVNFKKPVWWWIALGAATAAIADVVSSHFLKEMFFRLRPCNDESIKAQVHFLLNYRPQSSSFPSSHAVNHFALATFWFKTLKPKIGNKANWFYVWATAVIFAQVYVGVHYPFDVAGGALVGIAIGSLTAFIFAKNFKLEKKYV